MHKGRSVTAVLFAWLMSLTLLLASSGCAWLDAKQRQIIYRPTPAPAVEPSHDASFWHAGDETFFLAVPGSNPPQQVALWWLPHADARAPTLLYLHGTFRHLIGNQPKIAALRQAGFSILAVDYRGWGQSAAITPSETSIMQDALLAWEELKRRELRPSHRVIYGHSMGTGVAVTLASQLSYPADLAGLILESAFTSFTDIAAEAGFWASLAIRFNNERFASIDRIAQVRAPLLMLHGERDHTVPMVLGERLFAAANAPKQWVPISGAQHSDLQRIGHDAYQSALIRFKADHLSHTQ
jgi:alpha-beta hydrolase superfamily lysophospholipase